MWLLFIMTFDLRDGMLILLDNIVFTRIQRRNICTSSVHVSIKPICNILCFFLHIFMITHVSFRKVKKSPTLVLLYMS